MGMEILNFFYDNEYYDKRICVSIINPFVTMNVELDDLDMFLNENDSIELFGNNFCFNLTTSDITHIETNETEYGKELTVHYDMMDVIFSISES